MGLNISEFTSLLKEHYTDARVENMVYKDNPLHALLPKYEDFGGKYLPVPIIYANPQGRSADFSRAQARSLLTNTKSLSYLMTRVKDYSIAVIDTETLEASKGDANAFMDAATVEVDGAINAATRSLAISEYKSGWGEIGQIKAGTLVTSTYITLANDDDVVNFEVGMELVVADTVSASNTRALGSSTNGLIITKVNRQATSQHLTFAYNVNDATNGIPAIAAGDYLFVRGDRNATYTNGKLKVTGLAGWLPTTAPTAGDSFFGVDRSADPTRLAGLRKDISAYPIEEGLVLGANLVAREGGTLDHIFMNYTKFSELVNSLGSKVQYVDVKITPEVGFRGVMINGKNGAIKVIPDQNCPSGYIYGLAINSWKLGSLGKAIRVIEPDGLQMLRQSSADGVELRYGFKGNLWTNAAGHNIVMTY